MCANRVIFNRMWNALKCFEKSRWIQLHACVLVMNACLTDTELYTTSAAHSCVLLLVSRYPIVHSYGKLPWIERQAESCWMSRGKNTLQAVHMQGIFLARHFQVE